MNQEVKSNTSIPGKENILMLFPCSYQVLLNSSLQSSRNSHFCLVFLFKRYNALFVEDGKVRSLCRECFVATVARVQSFGSESEVPPFFSL